jgi:hypothetical protein
MHHLLAPVHRNKDLSASFFKSAEVGRCRRFFSRHPALKIVHRSSHAFTISDGAMTADAGARVKSLSLSKRSLI